MGTSFTIKLVADNRTIDTGGIRDEIQQALDTINARMSTYDPESELSRWNNAATADWFPVSGETAAVVAEAIRIGQATNGAFDVSLDPLVRLWQFGPRDNNDISQPEARRIPSEKEIEATLRLVGYAQIESRQQPPAVRKQRAKMRVDLSGIAKGHGVDRVDQLLKRRGLSNYMVEIGGEVRASGHNLAGLPWRIGIESPTSGTRKIDSVVELSTRAMATSGDYRNYFEKDGVRYSHLLDPRNGHPIKHRLASVTVLAKTCAEADALATGLMVLGPDAGFDLAQSQDFRSQDIAAAFMVRGNDGFVQKKTTNWPVTKGPQNQSQTESKGTTPTASFLASFIVLAFLMLVLSIGPVIRKRKMQCSCKTARQIMNATDPRRTKLQPTHFQSSPLLPVLPNDTDQIKK